MVDDSALLELRAGVGGAAVCGADDDFEPKLRQHVSVCMGCGQEIFDRYILRVAPNLEWHAACLKCVQCQQFLDESCTAFVRDGKTYCKSDYIRLFGAKCAKCQQAFSKNDRVMRARQRIYHVYCFRCALCSKTLLPGEEFALHDDEVYCKSDHDQHESADGGANTALGDLLGSKGTLRPLSNGSMSMSQGPSLGGVGAALHPLGSPAGSLPPAGASPPLHRPTSDGTRTIGSKKDKKDKPKTTRVRTVLNEKQLHTLRTCYGANPRPDALMKEQLVEMTGLSPRVIRVWFQNKRCKDKKRQIAMKQLQQQQEKFQNQALNGVRMQGVGPLVAASPTRHELGLVNALDIQQFQQSAALWAPLHLDHVGGPIESHTPFQQLIHDFGDPGTDAGLAFAPAVSRAAYQQAALDTSDMDSFSPQMAPSDLSSPSCSE